MTNLILIAVTAFGLSKSDLLLSPTEDTVKIQKVSQRRGRTPCQCFYFSTRQEKIDSIGIDGSLESCIPFEILEYIKRAYSDEYHQTPPIINFGTIRAQANKKNHGMDIGLYYFYLGHVSHASLFKVLVLENRVYIHLKRGDFDNGIYELQFKEFESLYGKLFGRKATKEMRDSFLRGIDDW